MTLRDSFRPKHQVLVLRCYPRFQKGSADIRPNSSELSYLLYYASTRRSKLPKLGAYLEKRSESDVRRGRLGNVQVTLHILTAMIDKCTRDLPLFAPFVLSILSNILASGDINFVEESVPTFGALCLHMDQTTFASDPEDLKHFVHIIATYAGIATKATRFPGRGNKPTSLAEILRFRTAGLNAIKSLVSADAFAAHVDQLRVVLPAVLEQLLSNDPTLLRRLQAREDTADRHEKDQILRRRQSMGARRSTEIPRLAEQPEADPAAVTGTTADIDARANEEVGVLAIQSLRKIFNTENRGQVRVATTAALALALEFATTQSGPGEKAPIYYQSSIAVAELFESICRWTAVQDRFVILVTIMEELISSSLEESDLQRQLVLAELVTRLLRSDINFIGLSVMDVLVGLIQHILQLLQISGKGTTFSTNESKDNLSRTSPIGRTFTEKSGSPNGIGSEPFLRKPSALRLQVLEQLQQCIADLAMHVYYIDQIGDMISALLLRLKPGATTSISSPTAAVENPEEAISAIASSVSLQEKSNADGFFSFDTARVVALQCVNEILVVANSQRKVNGSADIRNRVPVSIWEGTQWLLRDPDANVRRAYTEAFMTWLDMEVDQKGIRLAEESVKDKSLKKSRMSMGPSDNAPRRVVSNASKRKRAQSKAHSTFMQLLHLAIYEHAMSFADSDAEILRLHLLLATLVTKLGINSVRSGLSMIYQLQEDAQQLSSPTAVILVASLAHGYFMVLSRHFDFEHTPLGHQIQIEQSRRASQGLWANAITVPPALLVGSDPAMTMPPARGSALGTHPTELLKLMGSRAEMVDAIADGYTQDIASPPQSPAPLSAARPAHRRRSLRNSINSQLPMMQALVMPAAVKAEMLEPWSREACIKAAELERTRTHSISASKNGSGSGNHNSSSPDGRPRNGSTIRESIHNYRASAFGNAGLGSMRASQYGALPGRRHFSPGSIRTPASDSSARSVVRVDDLKRALHGAAASTMPSQLDGNDDTNSDSIVSGDFTASEVSLPLDNRGEPREGDALHYPPPVDADAPPVPELPPSLRAPTVAEADQDMPTVAGADQDVPTIEGLSEQANSSTVKAGDSEFLSVHDSSVSGQILPGRVDLQALLAESGSVSKRESATSTPPY